MKYRKIAVMIMSMALMGATGVAVQAAETENSAEVQTAETENSVEEQTAETESAAEKQTKSSARDKNPEADTDTVQKEEAEAFPDKVAVQIMLEGTSARAGSESVQIDGATVTITEGGTYMLSGDLLNGQIVVDAGDTAKVSLILNGVRITNEGSDCITVKSADEVRVTLSEGSENILSDADRYWDEGEYAYPDWDDYGYWGDNYEYRDDNGYWGDNYEYWDDDYIYRDEFGDWNDDFSYRDGYGYQDDDYGYAGGNDDWYRNADSGERSQAAPPEGRPGSRTPGSSGRPRSSRRVRGTSSNIGSAGMSRQSSSNTVIG